jgi:hypothetical protein
VPSTGFNKKQGIFDWRSILRTASLNSPTF